MARDQIFSKDLPSTALVQESRHGQAHLVPAQAEATAQPRQFYRREQCLEAPGMNSVDLQVYHHGLRAQAPTEQGPPEELVVRLCLVAVRAEWVAYHCQNNQPRAVDPRASPQVRKLVVARVFLAVT